MQETVHRVPYVSTATEQGEAHFKELLIRIEEKIDRLLGERTAKEWYSTAEAAELLGKAELTVREWCRLHRIRATKKISGRGKHQSWAISHDELLRYRREGLLPLAS